MHASPVASIPATTPVALTALLLAGATALAYVNSFGVPFVFDDVPSIIDNPSLRTLSPPWAALVPPAELSGLPVGGRPLVNFSLALNYAVGGTAPAGYHAVNLLIHLLAGLTLFGVLRRTLAPLTPAPLPLAAGATALWLLHPLQTESVTYVCQRAESLMALGCLLTLYTFVRSLAAPRPVRWQALSCVACLLGMASKEVMVAAPLLVFAYDRTFVAGSIAAAWRARRGYYLALASTWLLLAALVLGNARRGGTAGFGSGVGVLDYALTQLHAITHYLRLGLWPHPLVFDYGLVTVTTPVALVLPTLGVASLLGAVVFALRRNSTLGYLGLWFLALLAPTSSFVPVATQTMAEHRLYLPLAALAVAFVVALHRLTPRHALTLAAATAVALGAATAARNQTYRTELALWSDTIAKLPTNARAHHNLAILLFPAGRTDEALAHFATALRLRPQYPEAHTNLGFAYLQLGRTAEAIQHTTTALALQTHQPEAHHIRGLALRQLGRAAEAHADFAAAVRLKPDHAAARLNLAISLLEAGQLSAAITELETTVRLSPQLAAAHNTLGVALMRAGRLDEAAAHYATALKLQPDLTAARDNLALVRARLAAPAAR